MSKVSKCKTRYALLGILSIQPASGYEIKKKMEKSTDHFWKESDSSIYPILKQLLDEGMVTCEIGNAESGKPKKIYAITTDGQNELTDWLSEEPAAFQNRNELLLKVFFGWNVDSAITIGHIEDSRRKLKASIDKYKEIEKSVFGSKLSGQALHQYLTLKAGIIHTEAALKWCDEAIGALNHATK